MIKKERNEMVLDLESKIEMARRNKALIYVTLIITWSTFGSSKKSKNVCIIYRVAVGVKVAIIKLR